MDPCDLIPDDAILWVTMGDDAPHPTTWEEFQGDNAHGEDGDALAFLEDVATALHASREYRGGGGAAPAYVVRWYPVPAPKSPGYRLVAPDGCGGVGTYTFKTEAERSAFRLGMESAGDFGCVDAGHADGGACCECGGPHNCDECPVFDGGPA